MDKQEDIEPIKKQFKEVNNLYSKILMNLLSDKNNTKDNEMYSEQIVEHFQMFNTQLAEMKNDLSSIYKNEPKPSQLKKFVFNQKNVESMSNNVQIDLKFLEKEVMDQNEILKLDKKNLEMILKKPTNN